MSSKRVCPGCQLEHPTDYHRTRCSFCRTEFDTQRCNLCKEFKPTGEFYRYGPNSQMAGYIRLNCKPCNKAKKKEHDRKNPDQRYRRDKRFLDKLKDNVANDYDEWKKKIDIPFKPMSEVQWLEACSHFGGCAICGEEHIEKREFFINPTNGGRYTAWNVFPICGGCAKHTRVIENPFRWLCHRYGGAYRIGITDERSKKLLDYLTLQIEKAGEKSEQQT